MVGSSTGSAGRPGGGVNTGTGGGTGGSVIPDCKDTGRAAKSSCHSFRLANWDSPAGANGEAGTGLEEVPRRPVELLG